MTQGSAEPSRNSFSHLTPRGEQDEPSSPKRPWSRTKKTSRPDKFQIVQMSNAQSPTNELIKPELMAHDKQTQDAVQPLEPLRTQQQPKPHDQQQPPQANAEPMSALQRVNPKNHSG